MPTQEHVLLLSLPLDRPRSPSQTMKPDYTTPSSESAHSLGCDLNDRDLAFHPGAEVTKKECDTILSAQRKWRLYRLIDLVYHIMDLP